MRIVLAGGMLASFLVAYSARGTEPLVITVDASSSGTTIGNKFSDINVWAIGKTWLETASEAPDDYFRQNFPFIERVQLICATGGNEDRDLFKDPNDRTTVTDYDFDRLIRACENIVRKGLKPHIKTGYVPSKLSEDPVISEVFRTNLRPPKDYDAYYTYIKAVVDALKARFGLQEMKTWTWGVGQEYEGDVWFMTADGDANHALREFCKLYDYTVAALQDSLGAENVYVGAHCNGGRFDVILDHCAKQPNSKTGQKGAQIDYLAVSFYSVKPGLNTDELRTRFIAMRNRAIANGLKNLKLGIDEVGALIGWDGGTLTRANNEVEHPFQAACYAKFFHQMVNVDVDYCTSWALTTAYTMVPSMSDQFEVFSGIPVVSANLRNLTFRMAGSNQLTTGRTGTPTGAGNIVDCLAGFNPQQQVLRVLVYNYNDSPDATASEDVSITIEHAKPLGENVTVRTWRLDEDHGNWWKLWWADLSTRGIDASTFKDTSWKDANYPGNGATYSKWSPVLPNGLAKPGDIELWNSRQEAYRAAGTMKPETEHMTPGPDGRLMLRTTLKPHGVTLFEVSPVKNEPVQKPSS